jgi:hypothetical protein
MSFRSTKLTFWPSLLSACVCVGLLFVGYLNPCKACLPRTIHVLAWTLIKAYHFTSYIDHSMLQTSKFTIML